VGDVLTHPANAVLSGGDETGRHAHLPALPALGSVAASSCQPIYGRPEVLQFALRPAAEADVKSRYGGDWCLQGREIQWPSRPTLATATRSIDHRLLQSPRGSERTWTYQEFVTAVDVDRLESVEGV